MAEKMSKHNILCTICKEVIKSTEDICSTNCGHVFHFVCMSECQSQSTCPECLHKNTTTHKIYLFFDESKDENLGNNWSYKSKIIELHKQIEDSKSNYLHLQEKYVISQDSVRRLEGRIKKCDHNISQRSVILSDLEDRIKTLEELNQYLTIDNECKSEALTSKSNEITRLKNSVVISGENGPSATDFNEQINMLKQKLDLQSIQLDKESKCSQLSRDKKKLPDYIDLLKLEKNRVIVANIDMANETLSNSTKKIITKVACDFGDRLKTSEVAKNNTVSTTLKRSAGNNSSLRIYVPDIAPSVVGYSIINGHSLNNYFSKVIINNRQAKLETLRTSKHQITSGAKVKHIFKKLRNKCLICSTVLIFIFLMSNVTSVD